MRSCFYCGTSLKSHARMCPPCAQKRWATVRICKITLGRAIRHGKIPSACTLICVDCGKQADAYDHRDYREPLLVVPVCNRCNYQRGPAEFFDRMAA